MSGSLRRPYPATAEKIVEKTLLRYSGVLFSVEQVFVLVDIVEAVLVSADSYFENPSSPEPAIRWAESEFLAARDVYSVTRRFTLPEFEVCLEQIERLVQP